MGGGRCIRFALRIMLPVLRCGEGGLAPIFLPFLNCKIKKCMMRVPLVSGYGDWCRCRFGLGKIPGSSAKKRRQGGHYNHFGCIQVGWRWNAFSFLSAEKIVP